jgi:hypothetical protein
LGCAQGRVESAYGTRYGAGVSALRGLGKCCGRRGYAEVRAVCEVVGRSKQARNVSALRRVHKAVGRADVLRGEPSDAAHPGQIHTARQRLYPVSGLRSLRHTRSGGQIAQPRHIQTGQRQGVSVPGSNGGDDCVAERGRILRRNAKGGAERGSQPSRRSHRCRHLGGDLEPFREAAFTYRKFLPWITISIVCLVLYLPTAPVISGSAKLPIRLNIIPEKISRVTHTVFECARARDIVSRLLTHRIPGLLGIS